MKQHRKNLIFASLAVSTVLSAGATNATDHRMWREQVPLPVGPAIELKSEPVDPTKKLGNDSLPWREQVDIVDNHRIFIAEPALNRFGKLSDTRMWREQIPTDSSESELTAARDSRRSEEIHKLADN